MLRKYFQICMYSFKRNWEINLKICHTVPRFNTKFTGIESTFPVPFLIYMANCSWFFGMVSIGLIRKGKDDWFLHKGHLLDWLIFVLYLLPFVCYSKYFALAIFSLNLVLFFLHPFVVKYLIIFVMVIESNFTAF